MDAPRLAIVVAGMHRSGTSALTRAVNLLGVDLPERLVPGFSGNELGHWEPEEVVAIHDAMLAAAGSDVNDVVGFDPAWLGSAAAREDRQRIADFLARTFARSAVVAIKDPRICLVLPAWTEALDRLGIAQAYILPFRRPAEVAASLTRRQLRVYPDAVWPGERGGLLWLRHIVEAERATRGRPRSFVAFDRLLADWRSEMTRIGGQIGLRWPAGLEANAARIDLFLDRQHIHETASAAGNALPELDGHLADLRRMEAEPDWTGHRFGDEAAAAPIRRRYLNAYVMAMERRNAELSARARGPAEGSNVPDADPFEYGGLLRALDSGETGAGDEPAHLDADHLNRALARALREGSRSAKAARTQAAARAGEAESRARAAEERAEAVEERARAADERAQAAEDRARTSESREGDALARIEALERHIEAAAARNSGLAGRPTREDSDREIAAARDRHEAERARRIALEGHIRALRLRRPVAGAPEGASLGARLRASLDGTGAAEKAVAARAERVRASGLFDADWYLDTYPDVEIAGTDPLRHFVSFGSAEGRSPGQRFDAALYLSAYPDCGAAGYEPLFHYLDHGQAEGRAIFPAAAPRG